MEIENFHQKLIAWLHISIILSLSLSRSPLPCSLSALQPCEPTWQKKLKKKKIKLQTKIIDPVINRLSIAFRRIFINIALKFETGEYTRTSSSAI